MLRKWEARVPLPPQPQGPKPTSPASHESTPTTRLEATWGGGSSSTPALKPRNFRLRRPGRGGRARRERVPDAKPRCPPRSPDVCHPKEVCTPATGYGVRLPPSLLGAVTPGKASSRVALRRLERVFPSWGILAPQDAFPGCRRQRTPLSLARSLCEVLPAFGAGAATALRGEVPGAAVGVRRAPRRVKYSFFFPCQGRLRRVRGSRLPGLGSPGDPAERGSGHLGKLQGKESGVSGVSRQ